MIWVVVQIVVSIAIIWSVSASFEIASNYLGRNLSDGVKGATINAIGSSIPELLTTFIFLFALQNVDGFTSGLTTTVGSAMFNILVIPALVIIVVVSYKGDFEVKINKQFFLRDAVFLLVAQLGILIVVRWYNFDYWISLGLIGFYLVYIFTLLSKRNAFTVSPYELAHIKKSYISLSYLCVGLLFKRLNNTSATFLLVISVIIIGSACHLLVTACENISTAFQIPIYVVAVIVAAVSTSIPDAVLSIKDAKKGNISDALSNAVGSNIFDITFALGMPLAIFTISYQPIYIKEALVDTVSELLYILMACTCIATIIINTGKKVNYFKGITLLSMYFLFIIWVYLYF